MSFQSEDRSDVWSIGEIDGVWGLNRDVPVTRGHRRNRECGVVSVMMLSIAMISPIV